jgi:PepSY-associated TM region
MMRALVLVHRWMGVAFCLPIAMWFATGIVMHFVPFPALSETERIEGLPLIGSSVVEHGPDEAATASKIADVDRIRLIWRRDGGVYLVSGTSGLRALRVQDLTSAAVTSESLALAIAADHAQQRGLDAAKAAFVELNAYDQWTVPNRFDPHRPLYRIALNDNAGTEIYVSSVTGEVLLDTTRYERGWNYLGSVAHWIYPTMLRRSWGAWDRTVWWLSLTSLAAALAGAVLGTIRLRRAFRWIGVSRRGWLGWHHVLGLVCMTFVLTWSLSGWLSMDHGRLFSRGQFANEEAAKWWGEPAWSALSNERSLQLVRNVREIEWFAFDREFFRRERTGPSMQRLSQVNPIAGQSSRVPRSHLTAEEVSQQVGFITPGCNNPEVLQTSDDYFVPSSVPGAPVLRSKCGDVWFDIDGASGAMLDRFDDSRRAYRWFYEGLHTLNVHMLSSRPTLRTAIITGLCGLGLLFSLTGIVIGWRRLTLPL